MNSVQIKKLVTTAIIIALAMVFQMFLMLGVTWKASIVGSLVNLCIIVAATVVGTWSGVAVSMLTPFIAMIYAHQPMPMIPWIIAGNIILSLAYSLFAIKDKASLKIEWPHWCVVGVIGGLIKYVVIAAGSFFVLPNITSISAAASFQFWQPITAVIGMILGGIVITALPKSVKGLRLAK